MAKRSKSRKKPATRRRRRRVSGMGGMDIQGLLLAGAGAVVVSNVKKMMTKDPTKTGMVNAAPYVGLGLAVALPMLIKNPMVRQASVGMGAIGIYFALQKLAPNVVGQLDVVPVINSTSNRFRKMPQVSVNGVGYPLPNTSVYKDSMSVVNGVGCYSAMNPVNPGSANAY